jgi:MFS family permease
LNELTGKFREVLTSVLPITCMVLLLHFTVSPLEANMLYAFLSGSALVIIGLTIFLFGIDQGLEPIGHGIGNAITQSNSYAVLVTVSLILGFFISYAEPDIHILAKQVDSVTSGQFKKNLMVIAVSVGIGTMMTLGMLRILRNVRLKFVFTGAYALIFLLSLFSSPDFLAIAFDASGATTGAITVPFMLALAAGVSAMKKDSKLSEADSFGLVGISSAGAILGVLIAGLFLEGEKLNGALPEAEIMHGNLLEVYSAKLFHIAWESFLTLLPIIIAYTVFQIFFFKDKISEVIDIIRGIVLTFLGLVVFLLGVNGGFMEVGMQLGIRLASMDSDVPVLLVALLLGLTTVLAEPAVHVLTYQVEDVTGGSVKRNLVLIFLSVAVGLSIFMSALRILIPSIQLWMYLLPGFGLSVILAYFIPDLFVGMAYDTGGVASGPMTATFSLAFVQGVAAQVPTADVVVDGFGMIAIVAMMPILAIELLGALYQAKSRKASDSALNEQSTGGNHG